MKVALFGYTVELSIYNTKKHLVEKELYEKGKIQAIALHRQLTGARLIESKEYVDKLDRRTAK